MSMFRKTNIFSTRDTREGNEPATISIMETRCPMISITVQPCENRKVILRDWLDFARKTVEVYNSVPYRGVQLASDIGKPAYKVDYDSEVQRILNLPPPPKRM